jgi:hypothetical protein
MSSSTPIELVVSRAPLSPRETFLQLADQCDTLGISSFDVYGDVSSDISQSWLRRFEKELSHKLGCDDAVFMCSGIMAQNIALSIHTRAKGTPSFACHYSSHVLLHEQSAFSELLNLQAKIIPRVSGELRQPPVTKESMLAVLQESPVSCAIIECPHREIGGKCTSWDDLLVISDYCKRNNIALHMDGARLWEASAGYGKTLSELCSLFDSVYVSFYKGLGGVTGAMLLGKSDFIKEARVWQRRFGGNVYSQLPYDVSCWAGFRTHCDDFTARRDRLRLVVASLTGLFTADVSGNNSESEQSPLVWFDPPIPEVSLVHVYIAASAELAISAKNDSAVESGVSCFRIIRASPSGSSTESYFEFNMVNDAELLLVDLFIITCFFYNNYIEIGPIEFDL